MNLMGHIFHPGARMQDFAQHPPLHIITAKGAILETTVGPVIDAIGSWWCKPLGHRPPQIIKAIKKQLNKFDHVMTAQTTNTIMTELSEKLAQLSKLPFSFFSSDGSSAVEIALKLTLHARKIQGLHEKTKFLALKHGYHGETLGTLSVSDLEKFKDPYRSHCFDTHFIEVPYISSLKEPISTNASNEFSKILPWLETIKPTLNAIIFEPIVQGSAGMRIYSIDFLKRLILWAKNNNIYCIADEIMTGLGRTGHWFAMDHIYNTDKDSAPNSLKPDIMCLAKGLTAGTLPLSVALLSQELFDLFYFDKTYLPFIHSHTHSGNALAVSAALATLTYMESISINQKAILLQHKLHNAFNQIQTQTNILSNIRCIGGIIAADLNSSDDATFPKRLQQIAQKRGALLRPIGNTLYWFLPLNITTTMLAKLTEITYESIKETAGLSYV